MASAASAETATNEENLLEFTKSDNRRMLHVVYRVGDLDRTIKYSVVHSSSSFLFMDFTKRIGMTSCLFNFLLCNASCITNARGTQN